MGCGTLFRLQHLLGYSKADMLDKLAFDLHHHDDIANCQKCHASCKHFCRFIIVHNYNMHVCA